MLDTSYQFGTRGHDQAPLIIIGMHRSGTSVVTDALRTMGWHGGADDLGGHSESNFFLRENQRIFGLAHADWDNPSPVEWFLDDQDVFDQYTSDLTDRLASPESIAYWGDAGSSENLSTGLPNLPYGWGWKDPRNTVTLPVWLKLFPNAKVLNIVRNGADVASSLFEREKSRKLKFNSKARSSRCQDLQRCFSLWSEYVALADRWPDSFLDTQFKTIYYEELLNDPESVIIELLDFICSDQPGSPSEPDVNKLRTISNTIEKKNRNKNKDKPEVVDLYKNMRHHPLMQKHQYCTTDSSFRYAS